MPEPLVILGQWLEIEDFLLYKEPGRGKHIRITFNPNYTKK